jgi:hypothetical protein
MEKGVRLQLNSRVKQNTAVLSAEVGEAVVFLHAERNAYFDTDAVGAEVWRQLATPTTVRDLCDGLRSAYDVDPQTCEADVLAFLEEALNEGIICLVDPSEAAG